jgi:lysine 6-dehydrogenase
MRMLVLGAGLQGSACAFDLLQDPAVTAVHLADQRIDRLPDFLAPHLGGGRLHPTVLDVRDANAVLRTMEQVDAALSAAPYYFNFPLAELAVTAGIHFADLGGNTEIVFQQKQLHDRAVAKGVTIIPDCGVAPGMVNILAQHGIAQLDRTDRVKIYVGGLPQHPEPPLNYQVVYSLEGALDYYTTPSWVLREGRRTQVTPLTELEALDFPAPVGTLEAFHTAGGLSTLPFRYEGRVPTMEYKTLRYPGHAAIFEGIRWLGLLGQEPVALPGASVVPRELFLALAGPRLRKPGSPDLVALRVVVEGELGGAPARRAWQLVDRFDAERGITAMMRCTAYSLSITGQLQVARGCGAPGVHTPDEAVPAERYIAELARRGVRIEALA